MSILHSYDLPSGALAYREYHLALPDRAGVTIALTVGEKDVDTIAANFARAHGAVAYGVVSVLRIDEPVRPIVWLFDGKQIEIAVCEGDEEPDGALLGAIGQCLKLFFAEIAPVTAHVAALKFSTVTAGGNDTIH
jgi:hypothetical protein